MLFYISYMELFWIVTSTLGISFISFVGAVVLVLSEKRVKDILFLLVGLSCGTLMGVAFFHLIPESLHILEEDTFPTIILGFTIFFLLERAIWRHCHEKECRIHPFAYLNLVGDGIHNFIDGFVIAGSFLVDMRMGFITTMAVAAHEVPQELGDFGVIVYGGIKPKRALLYNFLSALAAVAGGVVGYFILQSGIEPAWLLPFAAGGFLYIAASDLVPELHKEREKKRMVLSFISFVFGIVVMWALKSLGRH